MLHPYLLLLFKALINLTFGKKADERLSSAEIRKIATDAKLSTRTLERMFGAEQETSFRLSTLNLIVAKLLKPVYGYIDWEDFERKEIACFVGSVERKSYSELSKQEQLLIDKAVAIRLHDLEKQRTGTCIVSIYHLELLRAAAIYIKTKNVGLSISNKIVDELAIETQIVLEDLQSFFANSSTPMKLKLSLLNCMVVYCSKILPYTDWEAFEKEIIPSVLLPYKTGMPALEADLQETLHVFVEKRLQELRGSIQKKNFPISVSKKRPYVLAALILVFSLLLASVAISQLSGVNAKMKIETSNFIIGEKKNLKVEYDISTTQGSWCIKNYGSWNTAVSQFDFRKLVEPIGACNFYCNKPGSYNLMLLKDYKVVSELPYYVNTKGWYAIYKGNVDSDVLPNTCGSEQAFMKNGILAAPEDEDVVWANFYYIRDMGIDGRNFVFEAKLRNTSMKEYDSRIWVYGERGAKVAANFVAKGATEYGYVYIGDSTKRSGENHADLSDFQIDLSSWRVVRIVVRNDLVNFYVDGHKVGMDYPSSMPLGRLRGLVLTFKGHGECDYVKVFDGTGRKLLFEEEFERH